MNNVYNDLKEISKEAREGFQEWNRGGPQYQLADYNTALAKWYVCKGYQEYKQRLKEKE